MVVEKEEKIFTKEKVIKEIKSTLITLAIIVVIAFVINSTLVTQAHVISGSMENTIMTGSRVVVNRTAYAFNEPERFDIIMFTAPSSDFSEPFIKRIIGLPNERVEIIDGLVFINGAVQPLDNSFVKGDAWGNYGYFIVPDDSFFVLGDNWNGSSDSRHWANRFVPRDSIYGRVVLEFFPTPQILD